MIRSMRETELSVRTTAREQIVIITNEIDEALGSLAPGGDGVCTIVVPHTTCALSVNENADPDVPADLLRALRAMIPDVPFRHGEGNSDAHFLSTLIGTSLTWPYRNGRLVLGRWQGIYFIELDGPRTRKTRVYVD